MKALMSLWVGLTFILLSPRQIWAQNQDIKELWVGTFEQSTPLAWSGEMELFLRYSSMDEDPKPLDGIVTWKHLNSARTKIEGTRGWDSIQFKEISCVEGGCNQVILGGEYKGKFDDTYSVMQGTAEIGALKFSGKFRLKRVVAPEN